MPAGSSSDHEPRRPADERDHAALGRDSRRPRSPTSRCIEHGDRARPGERRHGRARPLPAALAGASRRRRAARRRRTRRRAATRRASSSSPRGRRASRATFPTVHQFVVMNECNQPLFVNPQWDTSGPEPVGRDLRPRARRGLRRAQGREQRRTSSGASASRRAATTAPNAASNSSTTPVTFLGALGAWFKAFAQKTDRTAPLMDGLDFHPYPVPQSLPFATGYADARDGERLQPAADLPGVLRRRSTARRSGRSASRRAAGCRSASTRRASRPTRSASRATPAPRSSANAAGGVVGQYATEAYQATWYRQMLDLVACDPNVRGRQHLPPRRRAEPRRLAERALLVGRPDRRRSSRPGVVARLDRADRRQLPGQGRRRGRPSADAGPHRRRRQAEAEGKPSRPSL